MDHGAAARDDRDASDQSPTVSVRQYLDRSRLLVLADRHRAEYRDADPFPHVVLDGVLPDDALAAVLSEFPGPTSTVWKAYENYHEMKSEAKGEEHLGPATLWLLYQMNSAPFLQFLERLTGIDNLLPDPYFSGGGLHQSVRGGKLGIHADFNMHDHLPLHRRINVIVYLNHDWKPEYGGELELWDTDKTACRQRIRPIFNRMVVFSTTDWTYHGHPDPLTCPDDTSRKSIALYYFTVDRPAGEVQKGKTSTLFIQRPGEEVPPGTVFDRDTWSGRGPVPSKSQLASAKARSAVARVMPRRLADAVRAMRRPGERH